jgi:flagellar motor switch protein FliN/FliY
VSEEIEGQERAAVAEAGEARPGASPDAAGGLLDLVSDVPVTVTVEMGSSRMLLREVLQLDAGSVVELDRESGELADVLVNGRLVARGDVTVVDDRLAVRIVEVVRGR